MTSTSSDILLPSSFSLVPLIDYREIKRREREGEGKRESKKIKNQARGTVLDHILYIGRPLLIDSRPDWIAYK